VRLPGVRDSELVGNVGGRGLERVYVGKGVTYYVSEGVRSPRVLYRKNPQYPAATGARKSGTVLLQLEIDQSRPHDEGLD
jgi:hypothetical protein